MDGLERDKWIIVFLAIFCSGIDLVWQRQNQIDRWSQMLLENKGTSIWRTLGTIASKFCSEKEKFWAFDHLWYNFFYNAERERERESTKTRGKNKIKQSQDVSASSFSTLSPPLLFIKYSRVSRQRGKCYICPSISSQCRTVISRYTVGETDRHGNRSLVL